MSPRRRTKDHDLPPRVYRHGQSYRFVPVGPDGKNLAPINLGRDRREAFHRWAELVGEDQPRGITIASLWDRYQTEILPLKAKATQAGRRQAMRPILAVFGKMAPAAIEPHHAIRYLDERSAKVQANREISTLRALLSKAVHWGLLVRNPLIGLQYRNQETGRDRYVTDDELAHAIEVAPTAWLRALLWLAYLTGLRRRDLLALTRFQCQTEGLLVRESKTGKRVMILWTDELRQVVDEALGASPDDRLFPITESAVNNAWGRFQRSLAEDGHERFLLRDLRAKHATDLEDHGGDATVQLGHSSRSVTIRHYLRAPRRVVPIR